MKLLDKLKLLSALNQLSNSISKGLTMNSTKKTTAIVGAVIVFLTSVAQIPDVNHAVVNVITTHPAIAIAVQGIATLVALFHQPKSDQ